MQYTNKLGLPESVANAIISQGSAHRGERFTASGIANNSVRMHQLIRRHKDEITVDVADRYKAWMGSAIHAALEKHVAKNELSEQYLTMEVAGEKISGTADLLTQEGDDYIIQDYKTTSVNKVLFADYDEWKKQLSVYRCLFWEHGFKVGKLQVVIMLNDWYPSKARQEGYPRTPIVTITLVPMTIQDTVQMIEDYVKLVMTYEKTPDDDLPFCTNEELWARGEKFALMRKGRKTAIKLFDKEEEAEKAKGATNEYIEHRPPKVARCNYCDAKQFCSQYRALVNKGMVDGIAPSDLAKPFTY